MAVDLEKKAYYEGKIKEKKLAMQQLKAVIDQCDNVQAAIDDAQASAEEVIISGESIGVEEFANFKSTCKSIRSQAVQAYNSCSNDISFLISDLNAILSAKDS